MQPIFSIFPKFFQHLDAHGLAGLVREVGLDTTNLVIRDGYWVSREGMREDLPRFTAAMRREGLEVRFATAGFSAEEVVRAPELLRMLGDEGIAEFRMDYFRVAKDGDVRRAMERARAALERMVPVCERAGVRAVYQVHHGMLIASPSAAWQLVQGLPSRWIGVELDPGNQTHEGMEDFGRSTRLLGEYFVAAGIKDSAVERDLSRAEEPTKGWRRVWAPITDGVVNWHSFVEACAGVDFEGTFVFMPFYDQNDPESITRKLKREVEYLRGVMAEGNGVAN